MATEEQPDGSEPPEPAVDPVAAEPPETPVDPVSTAPPEPQITEPADDADTPMFNPPTMQTIELGQDHEPTQTINLTEKRDRGGQHDGSERGDDR